MEDRGGETRWQAAAAERLPAALDPLVQVRPLTADGGGLSVAGQDLGLVREAEEFAADALDDGRKAGIGIRSISRPTRKEGVAGKQLLTAQEADAAGSVARRVNRNQLVLPKAKALAVLDTVKIGRASCRERV